MAKYKSPPVPCETCPHNKETDEWCAKNCTNEDILAAGRVLRWMGDESDKEHTSEKRGK